LSTPTLAPRRGLSERQAETVLKLIEAAAIDAKALGFEATTMRTVASRAGVSSATVYSYFSSREHLFAELFRRRLDELEVEQLLDEARTPADAVAALLAQITEVVIDDPAILTACTCSLLSSDPEVFRVRMEIGTQLAEAIGLALKDRATPEIVEAVLSSAFGLLVVAGMGHLEFAQLSKRARTVTSLLLGEGP